MISLPGRRAAPTRAAWVRELLAALRGAAADAYLLLRLAAIGFSVLLPLLGAATVTSHLPASRLLALIAVAVAFHIYAYVLNDVIDLPVDRTEPLRAGSPLVRGVIRPGQALALALAQLPLALLLTGALGGGAGAYGALLAAFAAMTVYDLRGKRCPLPLLTDAVQGLGWGALVLFGALVAGGSPTALTAALAGYVFVYILMINGVHGALRDLANDLRCGARTTAALLGARCEGEEAFLIPRGLRVYLLALQALLAVLVLVPLAANWPGYGPAALLLTAAGSLGILLLSLLLLVRAARSVDRKWELIFAGMLHLVVSLGAPLMLLAFSMSGLLLATAVAFYVVPVLAMWGFGGMKWG